MRVVAARVALGILAAAVVVATLIAATPDAATAQDQPVRRILLVSLPRITWADVVEHEPPTLTALLARSAVASLSTRTIGPQTTAGEGYVTIGAGARAGVGELDAGVALQAGERYEGGEAAAAYRRRTGVDPAGDLLQLNIARIHERNERLLYGAKVGSLGTALHAAGYTTAVIGNADGAEDLDLPVVPDLSQLSGLPRHREAALALMDEVGQVDGGRIGRDITTRDEGAPFGVRLDPDAVAEAFRAAWSEHDVVLVEASDLERADAYSIFAFEEVTEERRPAALAQADELLATLMEEVDLERDLVMIMAPSGPRKREQLTVAALAGPGIEPGVAKSGTTRRDGFVTLPDIAPTVLGALGVRIPDSMTGTAITSTGRGEPGRTLIERFVTANEVALFRDDVTGPVTVTFIVLQVVVYALATLALWRGWPRLQRLVALLALGILAIPPVTYVSGLFRYDRLEVAGYVVAVLAAAGVLAAVALAAGRGQPLRSVALLAGGTLALLAVDQLTGERMQINTVFGYSPIVAGRFAGYGNLASALVAISSLLVASAVWSLPGFARLGRRPRLFVLGSGFAVVLVLVGHPALGSDVGGVLALVPAAATMLILLAGAALNLRRAALIGGITAVALAVFAAIDLSQPPEQRTHLGRLAARTFGSGGSEFATVIQRKAVANLSILTSSVWAYVIPIAFAFLAFLLWWRPQGFLPRLQERTPGLRAGLVGAIVAGTLGFALNDSGVAIPAMMLAVLLPYLTFLLLRVPEAPQP
jgi:hypothetical protein